MIRVLLLFLLLLASVLAGVHLSKDPGYVLIAYNHWTIESTLLVAFIAMLVLFFIFHGLLLLFRQTSRIAGNYHHWKKARRLQKAQEITRKGLIEFSEGYWSSAKRHLLKALPDTDMPLLNYLTAARAAQEMGENQLRDDYLREAQQSMPDARIAVELTQAQLQLANHQWEQALATLRHLQDLAPHHPYVLKLLIQLYQEVRDWPQLIALLPELKKYKVISNSAFDALLRHTFLQAMNDLVRLSQADALNEMVRKLPKSLQNDPDLVACYCQFLIQQDQSKQAGSILYRCLNKQFNEKLINLYGQIDCNEKQLTFAESLLKKQPNSAALYLCLGRLSASKSLWGKAREYFEKSLAVQEKAETYAEMGKLYELLGDQEKARQAWRKGLYLTLDQTPETRGC